MKEFDYVIIGGGCAGLSLAYELEINNKLKDKSLAIIEKREKYERDKTWSFWKVFDHNFQDCVTKSWNNFTINMPDASLELKSEKFTYQSIDSGKFYEKVNTKLKFNKNINFFKSLDEIDFSNSVIFNSVNESIIDKSKLWQHFQGIEIETKKNIFDEEIFNLMDFNCDQKDAVHFFYTLPFSKNKALVETTWLSNLESDAYKDYDIQLENYIKNNLRIKEYKINYTEKGAIPLYYPKTNNNFINIGTVGEMTRLSTGYTFLNIQEHSKYIRENLDNISNKKRFKLNNKYIFLDKIFLKVVKNNPEQMPSIFFNLFKVKADAFIKFMSNKSNLTDDLSIILKMPKFTFLKALF